MTSTNRRALAVVIALAPLQGCNAIVGLNEDSCAPTGAQTGPAGCDSRAWAHWSPNGPRTFTPHAAGTVDDSRTGITWVQTESAKMDWETAVGYCDNLDFDGHKDWQLPTRIELVSLVDYTKADGPAIDTTAFPDASAAEFWSASTLIDNTSYVNKNTTCNLLKCAYIVIFDTGRAVFQSKDNPYHVRCMRRDTPYTPPGAEMQAPACLYSVGTDSVTDRRTGLVWQRKAELLRDRSSWEDAKAVCADLAREQGLPWRVPTIDELHTLTDDSHSFPVLDPCIFPETPDAYFWSSTTSAGNAEEAWVLGIEDSYVITKAKIRPPGEEFSVRCVR